MLYAKIYVLLLTLSAYYVFPSLPLPPRPSSPPPPPPPPQIAFAVLALQWAKGVCKTTTCRTTPPASLLDFTIHSIWPKDSQGKDLKRCAAKSYDGNLLKPLTGDLTTYWPSFKKTNDQFWEHEWDEHGSCSGQPQVTFFQNALKITKNRRSLIMNELRNQGVSPSPTQEYPISKYRDGVKYAVGGNTGSVYQLHCQTYAKKKYLIEVRLCLDKTLQNFVACPKTAKDSCGNRAILYN